MVAEPRKNIEKPEVLDESLDLHEKSTRERADLSLELKESFKKEDLEKAKKAYEKLKNKEKPEETNWMPTAVKVGVALGGAYLGYKLYDYLTSEKKEEKSTLKPMLAAGLAVTAGMGYLYKDQIHEVISDLYQVAMTKKSADDFIAKIKEGKVIDAFSGLQIDPKDKFLEKASEKLDIAKRYLLDMKDVKLSEFLKHKESKQFGALTYATAMELQVAGYDVDKIDLNKTKDSSSALEDEDKLVKHLESQKFDKMEELTVAEALKIAENRKEKESKLPVKLRFTEDPEEAKKLIPQTIDKINNSKTADTIAELSKDVIDTAVSEGAEIVADEEFGTFIVKNGVAIFVSSSALVTQTFSDAIEASYSEEKTAGDVAASYVKSNGIVYLGLGVAGGAAWAYLKKENIVFGAFKGFGRGIIFPFAVAHTGANTAVHGYAWLEKLEANFKYWGLSVREIASSNPEKKLEYMKQSAAYNGIEFRKWYQTFQQQTILKHTPIPRLEEVPTKLMEKMMPERVNEMMKLHLFRFVRSREAYLAAQGKPTRFPFDLDKLDENRQAIDDYIDDFLREIDPRPPVTNLDETKAKLDADELRNLNNSEKIRTLSEASKNADDYLHSVITKVEEMQKTGVPQAEIDEFSRKAEEELKTLRATYKETLKALADNAADLSKEEKAALKLLLKQELAHANGVRGVLREVGGRGKFAVVLGTAHVVYKYYEATEEDKEMHIERELMEIMKEIGPETLQLVLDILSPYGLSDWYTVFSGKGLITQKEVSGWERVTRVVFGSYNLTTDLIATVGGAVTVEAGGAGGAAIYGGANVVEAALRAAGKSPALIAAVNKILPKIAVMGREAGGYDKLLRSFHKIATRGMQVTLGIELTRMAYAGYNIVFDTSGEEEIEFDFGEGSSGGAGAGTAY